MAHLTSVHVRSDTRIFHKMCLSLAAAGHDVTLIVADGLGDENNSHVDILDAGKPISRWDRFFNKAQAIYRLGTSVDADIYHIHDPELMPICHQLKRHGKTVVFDAHEDLPKQIRNKEYLPYLTRVPISFFSSYFETFYGKRLDAIVGATPIICNKFSRFAHRVVNVNNYPKLSEFEVLNRNDTSKKDQVCYVGAMSHSRGLVQMVDAMDLVKSNTSLKLGGKMDDQKLKSNLVKSRGWDSSEFLGFLDRSTVVGLMHESIAGLVTLHPTPSYIESSPVKMFEYMSAGIPFIGSDFLHWRKMLGNYDCGKWVNPLDPSSIARAIDELAYDPEEARRLGERGREAVEIEFNWELELYKLLNLYERLGSAGT